MVKDIWSIAKLTYGSGWIIEEQSGKIKILRRMTDGRKTAFIANFRTASANSSLLIDPFDKGVKNIK